MTTAMDFLDPKKERRNRIGLLTSYALVAIAITIASIVLLYQTDGYCIDNNGAVDRCGLIFLSSDPNGATITVNGKRVSQRTNTKLNLRNGVYDIQLSKDGYRTWQRQIEVIGGAVRRFDYPFLFPIDLKTSVVTSFSTSVSFASQSPDMRWLLVNDGVEQGNFQLYDLRHPDKPTASTLTIPATVFTAGDGTQKWQVEDWSKDNRHVLLLHTYVVNGASGQEYILLDRQNASASQNVTTALKLDAASQLSLFNEQSDEYYLYNTSDKSLKTIRLDGSAPTALDLKDVLAFKTYGDNTVLYVTGTPPSGKVTEGMVSVVLQQDNRSQVIRQLSSSAPSYVLDLAQYDGDWYVLTGAGNDKGVRIYKNPFDQELKSSASLPQPFRFLKVTNPSYVAFSSSSRYVLAESGGQCAVYDAEYDELYNFTAQALQAPQANVRWMDGDRLYYISGDKAVVMDYDAKNTQTLQAASPAYPLVFSSDYKYVFSILNDTQTSSEITSTSLRI